MPGAKPRHMARSRGLITDTERERIAREVEVEDAKRYQAISRVRRRVAEELPQELELLADHHPELYKEIQEAVCDDEDTSNDNER